MKKRVSDAFELEALKSLNLKPSKKNSLIDFLSVLPSIATQVCTVKNIQHGFFETGTLDRQRRRFPVFKKIMATDLVITLCL